MTLRTGALASADRKRKPRGLVKLPRAVQPEGASDTGVTVTSSPLPAVL